MDISLTAIIISVFSVLVAAFSLGWNIYRDVIIKAKVVVSIDKSRIISTSGSSPDYIAIKATNHGPGPIILNTISLKETSLSKWYFNLQKYAVLMYDFENPYTDHLPKKLEVGESLNLFFPYDKDCFLRESFTHIGITDSFGRTNWAPSKPLSNLQKKWKEQIDIES